LAFPLLYQGTELWKPYCFHPSIINWPQPQRRFSLPEILRGRGASSRSWPDVSGKGRMEIRRLKIRRRRTRIPPSWPLSLRLSRGAAPPDFPRKRKTLPDRRSPTRMGNQLPSPTLRPLFPLLYWRVRPRGQEIRKSREKASPPFPSLRPLPFFHRGRSREDSREGLIPSRTSSRRSRPRRRKEISLLKQDRKKLLPILFPSLTSRR